MPMKNEPFATPIDEEERDLDEMFKQLTEKPKNFLTPARRAELEAAARAADVGPKVPDIVSTNLAKSK
jgi:hypothetical protein